MQRGQARLPQKRNDLRAKLKAKKGGKIEEMPRLNVA
jgi:hypothetical protein